MESMDNNEDSQSTIADTGTVATSRTDASALQAMARGTAAADMSIGTSTGSSSANRGVEPERDYASQLARMAAAAVAFTHTTGPRDTRQDGSDQETAASSRKSRKSKSGSSYKPRGGAAEAAKQEENREELCSSEYGSSSDDSSEANDAVDITVANTSRGGATRLVDMRRLYSISSLNTSKSRGNLSHTDSTSRHTATTMGESFSQAPGDSLASPRRKRTEDTPPLRFWRDESTASLSPSGRSSFVDGSSHLGMDWRQQRGLPHSALMLSSRPYESQRSSSLKPPKEVSREEKSHESSEDAPDTPRRNKSSSTNERGVAGFCLRSRKGYLLLLALGAVLLILGLVLWLTGLLGGGSSGGDVMNGDITDSVSLRGAPAPAPTGGAVDNIFDEPASVTP